MEENGKCNLTQEIIDKINDYCQKIHKLNNNDPQSLQGLINEIIYLVGEYCPEFAKKIVLFRDNINTDNPEKINEFEKSKTDFIELVNKNITI